MHRTQFTDKMQPIPYPGPAAREGTMQSSMSLKWGATLQPLAPMILEPTSISEKRDALLALRNVQTICASSCGKDSYEIEVHLSAGSSGCGLPAMDTTISSLTLSAALNTGRRTSSDQDDNLLQNPRIRLHKKLWEFIDLRDNVYNIVHSAHNDHVCKFCWNLLDVMVVRGVDPGGVFLPLFGNARAARKLTKFVTDLLVYTTEHTSVETRDCCTSQTLVSQAIHEFLSIPTPTTDAAFISTDAICMM